MFRRLYSSSVLLFAPLSSITFSNSIDVDILSTKQSVKLTPLRFLVPGMANRIKVRFN